MAARYGPSSDSQIARTVPCVADGGLRRDAGRDLVGAVPERVALDDLGHEPDAQRGLRGHALVVAGQRHAQRLAETDPAHQADRLERATPCPYVTCESKNVASGEQITMSASLTK